MKIEQVDFVMDGGTTLIKTDKGEFYVDGRLSTDTEGAIFNGYPDEGGSKEVPEIKGELVKVLKEYMIENKAIFTSAIEDTIDDIEAYYGN